MLKFEDDVTEKAQAVVVKSVSDAGSRWTMRICGFSVYNRTTGEKVDGAMRGEVCHAALSSPWRNMERTNDGILVNAMKESVSSLCPEFVLWIFQKSPYAFAVVNRDDDEQLLNNGAVIDMKLSGRRGALWMCKAVRYLTEEVWKATNWKKLVDFGVDPLMAFIGSSIINAQSQPDYGGSHCGLFGYKDVKGIVEYRDKMLKAEVKNDGTASQGGTYGCGVWGTPEGRKVKKPDGWGGYTEVMEAGGFEEYAKQLIQIDKNGKLDK